VSHAQVAVAAIVTGLCSLSVTRSVGKLLYSSAAYAQLYTCYHAVFLSCRRVTFFPDTFTRSMRGQTGNLNELTSADKSKKATHERVSGVAREYCGI
jgi:hypothetical protein